MDEPAGLEKRELNKTELKWGELKTRGLKQMEPKKRQLMKAEPKKRNPKSGESPRVGLEKMITDHGYTDFKWVRPKDIVTAEWVRMKCLFGCKSYGRNASCPPNVPTVAECRRFFDSYATGVVFHFQKKIRKPEERHAWSRAVNQDLLKLERAVFLAGYYKVFLLFMDSCALCAHCPGVREQCKNPASARPSPESMGVDVFSTARRYDYPIEVLPDYSQMMNRYAFLLIE